MTDPVYIIPPKPMKGHGTLGTGTKILDTAGRLLAVTRATVTFDPNEYVMAELTVLANVEEVWAYPFMSEDSFLEAAKRYGYKVEKTS